MIEPFNEAFNEDDMKRVVTALTMNYPFHVVQIILARLRSLMEAHSELAEAISTAHAEERERCARICEEKEIGLAPCAGDYACRHLAETFRKTLTAATPKPKTRPLTCRDRTPRPGDFVSGNGYVFGIYEGAIYPAHYEYVSRADGGPITCEGEGDNP